MPSTSSKEADMDNVATFKTTRDTSKALVVVENMNPREALELHTSVKEQGKGAIGKFVKNDTPYSSYGNYYYQMKKLGVMPMKPRKKADAPQTKETQLEVRIQQLEKQLQTLNTTVGKRAALVAAAGFDDLNYRTRKFLGDMITKDLPTHKLSVKQEEWLSSLETRFGI